MAYVKTADWSCVAAACVPDDTNTTPARYDAVMQGFIRFQGTETGDLYFYCNVLSPLSVYGQNPTWNAMCVTFMNPNKDGFVEVKLIRKRKDNGKIGTNATYKSDIGAGIRQEIALNEDAFDFVTYAYFVRIQLHRDTKNGSPEFHVVSLTETFT